MYILRVLWYLWLNVCQDWYQMRSTWYLVMNYTWVCPELFQSDITGLIQLYNNLGMASALHTGNPLNIQNIIHCKIIQTVESLGGMQWLRVQKVTNQIGEGAGKEGKKCFLLFCTPLLFLVVCHFCSLRLCMLPNPSLSPPMCLRRKRLLCRLPHSRMVKHF